MTTTLRRFISLAVAFVERFVLPMVFFRVCTPEFIAARDVLAAHMGVIPTFVKATPHIVLFLVGFLTGLLLLIGRRATAPPKDLKMVLIPLASTYYYLLYALVPRFPLSLRINFAPVALQNPLLIAGLTCMFIGPMIALWGILSLNRSFGIFVTVRTVVLGGPYRWVRHPMYLGWILLFIGLALANFCGAYLIIVTGQVCLIAYRAHLEEMHLAEHSLEYRENMKRTGFLFPRFRRPSVGLVNTPAQS